MPSIANGGNTTGTFGLQDSITIQAGDGYARFESPIGTVVAEFRGSRTFGPYDSNTWKVTSLKGALYCEVADGRKLVPAYVDSSTGSIYSDSNGASLASGAGIQLKTLAEMLAWTTAADGTSCYVTDLYSGVRGLFQWSAASSKWRPAAMVLVDRSLTLDSGVNNTSEQCIKSVSVPAGLLSTGTEIMFEYTLARSNTTDAGAAANLRVGNAGAIADAAFGNGSGCISLSSTTRSFGNMHRYRVVSATQIEKAGTGATAGTSFSASGSSVAVGPWTVGDTTARLYFSPTVQLAAATGSTLPQVGYMALWLLPS